MALNRDAMLDRLPGRWDVIIIGGGATGLGCAVESATRGYRTLLVEQSDFAKATSSRSTKLIHGGLRYLRQGNVSLVFEALRERGRLIRNAPHLVHDLSFVIPLYDWWEGPFYGLGLRIYDLLAGDLGLARSRTLSIEQTLAEIPNLEPEGLRGGIVYSDAQFDDARLAITLALTAADHGATLLNAMRVESLLRSGEKIAGVVASDLESGDRWEIQGQTVINATGVFADAVRALDEPAATPLIHPSQGVHLVLDRSFHSGSHAMMVPHTADGRVLFAVPWHDHLVIGTTDTPVPSPELEPRAKREEITFLLEHASRYLTRDPAESDIRSCFAGLRPLVVDADEEKTASLSRDHVIMVSASGLLTVTGGKWTTYRRMAQETIDRAAEEGSLERSPSVTKRLRLHGWTLEPERGWRSVYGSDAGGIAQLE
ncbi:MAG TPA: glycerol-3-phosphate dehydrogenase/oxidase, partial [Thermoanaerobaculia bacterium]|nr:glycerol-3-phosphate dehydrogenase/oxidase [Thermoanaerobaculia bacterium]